MIVEALNALVGIQQDLTISSPVQAQVERAYAFMPPGQFELPGPRCWLNEFAVGTAGLREALIVTIHMQFLADLAQGDSQFASEVACAFWEALMARLYPSASLAQLQAAQGLIAPAYGFQLRGGNPTVGLTEHGGKGWIAAEGFIDLRFAFGVAADP